MSYVITYSELVGRIQSGEVTKEEAAEYFEIDENASQPFLPRFRINARRVDISGLERSASAAAHQLALDAEAAVQERTIRSVTGGFRGRYILAEGDSWFSHPLTATVIDVLQRMGTPVYSLAAAGKTFDEILERGEYLSFLQKDPPLFFLFSAGGNDILGDLSACVDSFDPDRADPDDAEYYIHHAFEDRLDRVQRLYAALADQVVTAAPQTRLIVHGYAYARPSVKGMWLGRHFAYRGFDLNLPGPLRLAREIVRVMLDRFNNLLQRLADEARIVHADFRHVLGEDDAGWGEDELQPCGPALRCMAEIYARQVSAGWAGPVASRTGERRAAVSRTGGASWRHAVAPAGTRRGSGG